MQRSSVAGIGVGGVACRLSAHAAATHAGSNAAYQDPYRLYNLDVAFHEADSTLGLYGSVPLLLALKPGQAIGVFL